MGDKPDRAMRWRDWSRDPLWNAALAAFLLFVGGFLAFVARTLYRSQVESGISFATQVPAALAVLAVAAGLAVGLRAWVLLRRVQQERLAALRAGSLPERTKQATDVLLEATTLVEELQDELTARTALLEDVQRQVEEGRLEVDKLEKLSQVDEGTARAVETVVDKIVERRVKEFERAARKREWTIGTVVAVPAGMLGILFAHLLGL